MAAGDIAVGVGATVMSACGLYLLPRVWGGWLDRKAGAFRGREWTHGELGLIMPFGPAVKRGMQRSFPVLTVTWCCMTCFAWIRILAGHGSAAGPRPGGAAGVAAWVFTVLSLLGLATMLAVIWFNRPKFVVPPRYRDQPGAVSEWIANWRSRKRHSR
jgi:hypothetical protein